MSVEDCGLWTVDLVELRIEKTSIHLVNPIYE